MGILVDPYMFELTEEKEIQNNISFFMQMIKLCKTERLKILFYKGMLDKIHNRAIQPFPIMLENIYDKELKETIIQINNAFSNMLLESIESIDIEQCSGEQEFEVNDGKDILNDSKYYEMLVTLLIPCYLKDITIENKILTGNKKNGKQIGDKFQIECSCHKSNYMKECIFSNIESFVSKKELILRSLRQKKRNHEIEVIDCIPTIMGDHHNHIQSNKKSFSTLNELSFKNKQTLKLFQEIGLKKVIFARFLSKGTKNIGSIKMFDVKQKSNQDIVKTKFIAETGFEIITDLYFPKEVGRLLFEYFEKNLIEYSNVSELLDKIS